MSENFLPLIAYHRRLGYSLAVSIRLAHWCLDYSNPYRGDEE
jgi:hypothetical protein